MVAFTIHKLVQLAASLGAKVNESTSVPCHYFLRLSGDVFVQVEPLCHTIVSTSVDLLALLWPQGFADFVRIEDMPKPPRPSVAGGLHYAFRKDAHLSTCGGELNRRLLQAIDQGKDSLALCCACTSVDAMIQAVKQDAMIQAIEEQQCISGEHVSEHSDQPSPQNVETVDQDADASTELPEIQHEPPPQIAADFSPPPRPARRWQSASDGTWSQQNEERSDPADALVQTTRSNEEQSVHEDVSMATMPRKQEEGSDPAEHHTLVQATRSNEEQSDDEDLPLCQAVRWPLQEDPSDEENQSLASLLTPPDTSS